MKKLISITILILLLQLTYADTLMKDDYVISIDGKINNDITAQTYQLDNTILLVDAIAFMSAINGRADWYEDAETMLCFANNCQISSMPQSHFATIAGIETKLKAVPIWQDQAYFLPLDFLCQAYSYNLIINDKNIQLKKRDASFYQVIEETECQSYEIKELGLITLMPYGWTKLNENKETHSYGIADEYDNYSLDYSRIEANNLNLKEWIKKFRYDLIDKNHELILSKIDEITLGAHAFLHFNSHLDKQHSQKQNDYYFIKHNNYIYMFDSQVENNTNNKYYYKLRNGILANIEFRDDYFHNHNHFYMHKPAFERAIKINNVSENQLVRDYLPFSAITKENNTILFAKVSKESESITFKLTANNKQFDEKIYTPFGIGRHNIDIYTYNN